jgi:hypothetical protein
MTKHMVSRGGNQEISYDLNGLNHSIMAPISLVIIPGRRDPTLCVPPQDFLLSNKGSLFLPSWGLGSGGVS